MVPTACLLMLAPLLSLVLSSPAPSPGPAPEQYYLRTSIVDATNDTGTDKCDLYLTSYHTGAGLSDAVLTPNISLALSGYLNTTSNPNSGETTWITNITSIIAAGQNIYWDLCGGFENEANWQPMSINLGDYVDNDGCYQFYADGDLLVFEYGAWLACDWWHGVPQLFYITGGGAAEDPFQAPSSCSLVDLQMIAAPAAAS